MTAGWDDFRNSGGWPYETQAEAEQRLATRGQPEEPEQPGQEVQPDGGDLSG